MTNVEKTTESSCIALSKSDSILLSSSELSKLYASFDKCKARVEKIDAKVKKIGKNTCDNVTLQSTFEKLKQRKLDYKKRLKKLSKDRQQKKKRLENDFVSYIAKYYGNKVAKESRAIATRSPDLTAEPLKRLQWYVLNALLQKLGITCMNHNADWVILSSTAAVLSNHIVNGLFLARNREERKYLNQCSASSQGLSQYSSEKLNCSTFKTHNFE